LNKKRQFYPQILGEEMEKCLPLLGQKFPSVTVKTTHGQKKTSRGLRWQMVCII